MLGAAKDTNLEDRFKALEGGSQVCTQALNFNFCLASLFSFHCSLAFVNFFCLLIDRVFGGKACVQFSQLFKLACSNVVLAGGRRTRSHESQHAPTVRQREAAESWLLFGCCRRRARKDAPGNEQINNKYGHSWMPNYGTSSFSSFFISSRRC